jgi:hypothetical protein
VLGNIGEWITRLESIGATVTRVHAPDEGPIEIDAMIQFMNPCTFVISKLVGGSTVELIPKPQ